MLKPLICIKREENIVQICDS